MCLHRADQAKAIDNVVCNKLRVAAVDFAVLLIVVPATFTDVRRKRGGKFLRLVAGDQVHHVIGNQRREPAHSVAGKFQIVGDPDRRGSHDFNFLGISSCGLGAFLYKAEAPCDEVGIGKLENYAIGDSAGEIEYLGPISRDPNRRRTRCPGQARALAVVLGLLSGGQCTEVLYGLFQLIRCDRLLAKDTARAVTAADAEIHASAGNQIERREQARRHRDVASRRIGHAGAEPHLLRIRRHEREQRIRLQPQHVRIEDPAIMKSRGFCLACERDDAVYCHVGLDGHTELHHCSSSPRNLPSKVGSLA